jgi:hypothetical protein
MYPQRHPAATSRLEIFLNLDQLNKETIFRLTRTVRVVLSQLDQNQTSSTMNSLRGEAE